MACSWASETASLSKLMFVQSFLCSSHLRYDTLAQMLTLGNVHAGTKMIVMETCAGLVLGAVMERMGGELHLSHTGMGNTPAERQGSKMFPQLWKAGLNTSSIPAETWFPTGERFCISWIVFFKNRKKVEI